MASILPYLPFAASAFSALIGSESQHDTNDANRQNAREQMDFQEKMSNTAHQREVKDLIAAGINPMLSAKLGGSSTPTGAMSVNQNPAETGSRMAANSANIAGVTTQIQNTMAQTALANANTEKTNAERDEIVARTPTHPANIENINQQVKESQQRIENLVAEMWKTRVSNENIQQQTNNLEAIIPQIQATIDNIKEHTKVLTTQGGLAPAQTALHQSQTKEISQRTNANLPALERALMDLTRIKEQMQQPANINNESFHNSAHGAIIDALGNAMRALNPFGNASILMRGGR